MAEKWSSSYDIGNSFGALLTDLSKAFDCILLELIIAKPAVYGFKKSAPKVMYSYLFNIFLCNIFLTMKNTDFVSYTDDNTPYTTGENIDDAIGILEEGAKVQMVYRKSDETHC